MWMQMFGLLIFEGLLLTTIAYVFGGAIVRNMFRPKLATSHLVVGYLFVVILTPVIAMMFAKGNTWADASDAIISSSWKSVVVVLVVLAIIRVSRKDEAALSADDKVEDISADIMEAGADDPELVRQLMSINEQVGVGLLSEQEAAERRAELLKNQLYGHVNCRQSIRERFDSVNGDPHSRSDTGEQLTGSKNSLNIPFPAWQLALIVVGIWLIGLGMEHGPDVFDIGAETSGHDRFLTFLGSQSTAAIWLSGAIALLPFGIFALVRRLRDGVLPGRSLRFFLLIMIGVQVWFVSNIQSADESQSIREYLEMHGGPEKSSPPIEIIRDDPVQADENLWLMRVYKQDSTMTFEFQFDTEITSQLSNKELSQAGRSMGQDLADKTCADTEGGRRQLESGITVEYVYIDANGESLSEVSVSKGDCVNSNPAAAEHKPLANYELTITNESQLLIVKGVIASGISANVQVILSQNTDIGGVVLSSTGGLVGEGHQLASLIAEYRLDTFAHENCYSACMIAFAAGAERFLVSGTTLGFHQYSDGFAEQDAGMGLADLEEAERLYFLSRGISEQFLDRIFDADHDDMWYPTVDELLQAGVIHDTRLPSSLGLNWDGMPANFLGVDIPEIILDQFSAFNVLKTYDIEMYERIKHDIASEMERGSSPAEMQQIGIAYSFHLMTNAVPNAANATVVNYFAQITEVMRELNEQDPFSCIVYAMPDLHEAVFNPGLISPDRMSNLSDAWAAVIEDSYTIRAPAIDHQRAEQIIADVSGRMASPLALVDPGKMSTEEDYRKACEALIAFNEAILGYSADVAGNTVRSYMSRQ